MLSYEGLFHISEKKVLHYCRTSFVSPVGFEPTTASLEGRCSIQLSYEPIIYGLMNKSNKKIVGVAGFEPATSSSQTRRDNRATLHPEFFLRFFLMRRGRDSNPRYPYEYNTLAGCRFQPLSHLSCC